MVKEDAIRVVNQIEAICLKHNLWCVVESVKQPELKMIKIKEISIKVE
jgi:hypothetical protein